MQITTVIIDFYAKPKSKSRNKIKKSNNKIEQYSQNMTVQNFLLIGRLNFARGFTSVSLFVPCVCDLLKTFTDLGLLVLSFSIVSDRFPRFIVFISRFSPLHASKFLTIFCSTIQPFSFFFCTSFGLPLTVVQVVGLMMAGFRMFDLLVVMAPTCAVSSASFLFQIEVFN